MRTRKRKALIKCHLCEEKITYPLRTPMGEVFDGHLCHDCQWQLQRAEEAMQILRQTVAYFKTFKRQTDETREILKKYMEDGDGMQNEGLYCRGNRDIIP